MKAVLGNKIVTVLLAIILLGLAGCAGAPPVVGAEDSKLQYGPGAMRGDNPQVSG